MTKQEMTQLLRSVGANENTVTAMENAYDLGVEFGRESYIDECEESLNQAIKEMQGLQA